jgi:GTP-binding protein
MTRTLGEKGESKTIFIEVSSLADVGLVGLPNVGKSTFISQVTNNRSKIGNYEFTTLEPNIGVLEYYDKSLVVADLPGIIPGACKNKGLGIETLENISKCKILLHFVSMDELDNKDPYESFLSIENELKSFGISAKRVVVGTKIDNAFEETMNSFKKHFKTKPFFISLKEDIGVNELIKSLFESLF